MKLSSREKIMVGGLAVIVAAYSIYNFIFMPKLIELREQKERYESNLKLKSSLNSEIEQKDNLSKRVEALKLANREIQQAIPQLAHQEQIIVYIENIFKDSDIKTSSISFSDTSDETEKSGVREETYSVEQVMAEYDKFLQEGEKIDLQEYSLDKKSGEAEADKVKNDDDKKSEKEEDRFVDAMGVKISFSGNYADLKKALLEMEKSARKVIIKSVAINNTEQNIEGTIELEFPYYYENEQKAEIEWNIKSNYGNSDPFMTGRLSLLNYSRGSGSNNQSSKSSSEDKLLEQSDF
ncbi:hypothetical protein EAL2_c16340 [Peptoclostridium acidaminophilum DSM 3953]|uniref:Type IV pilus assembly protein PilO n=1 Tax=Peptoclostridium acidaminophilum DSM 3953 TaxID=1286171 RepID=W8T596_PEPAC|nr:hypothetical protein [Peptoclostridium acidaminophilum]AHM56929.1 hypothetical protein EAL2_c16340 [Peptoclostridium acidaminophilum DSM 3953]